MIGFNEILLIIKNVAPDISLNTKTKYLQVSKAVNFCHPLDQLFYVCIEKVHDKGPHCELCF